MAQSEAHTRIGQAEAGHASNRRETWQVAEDEAMSQIPLLAMERPGVGVGSCNRFPRVSQNPSPQPPMA
jgi:hypothetical protein